MTTFRSLRRLVLTVASLVGIAVVLWVARAPILTAVAAFLTVEDTAEPADVIFVLRGEVNVRPTRAVELYHAGLARTIVMPRAENPDGDTADLFLHQQVLLLVLHDEKATV